MIGNLSKNSPHLEGGTCQAEAENSKVTQEVDEGSQNGHRSALANVGTLNAEPLPGNWTMKGKGNLKALRHRILRLWNHFLNKRYSYRSP